MAEGRVLADAVVAHAGRLVDTVRSTRIHVVDAIPGRPLARPRLFRPPPS